MATRKAKPTTSKLLKRIEKCIDERVRPMLQMDGGEIEIVELTPKKILKVRLQGACHGCAMAAYTLQFGVQNAIDEEFPKEGILIQLEGEE